MKKIDYIEYPTTSNYGSGILINSTNPKLESGNLLKAIDEIKVKRVFKKEDFYPDKDKAPSWLADEFDIKWIKRTELVDDGITFITPYEVFFPTLSLQTDKKYDIVILWMGKKVGTETRDIQLF